MNRSANPEWWPDGSLTLVSNQPPAAISTAGKKDESQTTLSDGSGIRPTTMGFQFMDSQPQNAGFVRTPQNGREPAPRQPEILNHTSPIEVPFSTIWQRGQPSRFYRCGLSDREPPPRLVGLDYQEL